MDKLFTGCRDVDYQILLALDDQDVFKAFQLNSTFEAIGDDENFWRLRIQKKINPYLNKSLLENNKKSYKEAFLHTDPVTHTLDQTHMEKLSSNDVGDIPIKNGDVVMISNHKDVFVAMNDTLKHMHYVCFGPTGPMSATSEHNYIEVDIYVTYSSEDVETHMYEIICKYINKMYTVKLKLLCVIFVNGIKSKRFLFKT
jgi:hypothetical protein